MDSIPSGNNEKQFVRTLWVTLLNRPIFCGDEACGCEMTLLSCGRIFQLCYKHIAQVNVNLKYNLTSYLPGPPTEILRMYKQNPLQCIRSPVFGVPAGVACRALGSTNGRGSGPRPDPDFTAFSPKNRGVCWRYYTS